MINIDKLYEATTINTDHRYMGIRFYFEDDTQWMDKVRQKI